MKDIEQRLDRLQPLHREMTELAPEVPEEYRKRLRRRIESLDDGSLAVDEHIFGMEVALFAERSNVDEELIRLHSHLEQCRERFIRKAL